MVESSLANWDGSKTPVNSTPPGSAQKKSNSSTSENTLSAAIPPHLETSSGGQDANLGLSHRVDGHRTSGGGGVDEEQEQAPRYMDNFRRASSLSVAPVATSSLAAPRSSLDPRLPLHFGTPREILTTPLTSSRSAPSVLGSGLARPPTSITAPAVNAPDVSGIMTGPSTSTSGAIFGQPGAALRDPNASTTAFGFGFGFGTPGPALRVPPASQPAVSIPAPDSIPVSSLGPSSATSERPPASAFPISTLDVAGPKRSPYSGTPSPLASALARTSSATSSLQSLSPSPRPGSGGWWLTAPRENAPPGMTIEPRQTSEARHTSSWSHSQPLARTQGAPGKEMEKEREKDKDKELVTYTSRAKKSTGNADGSNGSVNAKDASADGDELFIPSPELSETPTPFVRSVPPDTITLPPDDARLLFTPSPSPLRELFSPPPHEDTVRPARGPPPPGVGVARRIVRDNRSGQTARPQKRKREVMQYVAIPRASYPMKRPRTEESGHGGRAWARSSYSAREESESAYSARRSANEYDEGEGGTSWPKKKQVKGEVHRSLDDALNAAWTHNEAGGAIPVGGKRKERESYTDKAHKNRAGTVEVVVAPRKRPKIEGRGESEGMQKAAPRTTGDHEQPEKRIRKAPPRPDDHVSLAPAQVPAQSLAWCEESGDMTRLRFDVLVEEADRMACEALLHSGIPGVRESWTGVVPTVRASPCPAASCLVWPIPPAADADGDVSAGGPILWNGKGEDGRRRVRDGNASSESKPRDEEPRGRSKQKKIPPPPQKRLSPVQHRKEPVALPETHISRVEQPLRRLDLSMPIPKVKPKPRALAISSKSHGPIPSKPGTSPLFSPSPFTPHFSAASPPPPQKSPLPSPLAPASLDPIDSHTEPAVEEDIPIALSAKAKGKQKAPSEHAERTPSPMAADTWLLNSGSRGRRSTSRGRRSTSRRTSASRVRNGAAVHSPADSMNMSLFLNEFDTSPARMPTASLQTSPEGFHYDSTIPPLPSYRPSSIHDPPFAHSSERQLSPPPFAPFIDHQPYGDGTVDPSLLGGGMMEPDVQNSYDDPEMEDDYGQDEEGARMRSSSPSAASSSSDVAPVAPPASAPTRRVSQRGLVQRYVPADMVPTDLFDSDDDSFVASSSSIRNPRPPPKAQPAVKPKRIVKRRPVINGETKVNDNVIPAVPSTDRFFRYSGPPWPPGPEAFCHQCRNRGYRMSMTFAECGHVYCVRCIMMKYDQGTVAFELTSPNNNCPRCNNTCSCDNCTARRGEIYKFGPGLRPKQQNPYHVLREMVIEPTTYYATMYDVTGARVAQTYLGADGNKKFVVAQPMQGRRVFIGAVQEEWKLGPKPVVFIDPTMPGKQINGRGSGRFYVGNESVLSLRVLPRPPVPSPRIDSIANPAFPETTTPPTTPLAAHAELGDAFASPLTSVPDSDTAGEDDIQVESKVSGEDAFPVDCQMPAVDYPHGESKTADTLDVRPATPHSDDSDCPTTAPVPGATVSTPASVPDAVHASAATPQPQPEDSPAPAPGATVSAPTSMQDATDACAAAPRLDHLLATAPVLSPLVSMRDDIHASAAIPQPDDSPTTACILVATVSTPSVRDAIDASAAMPQLDESPAAPYILGATVSAPGSVPDAIDASAATPQLDESPVTVSASAFIMSDVFAASAATPQPEDDAGAKASAPGGVPVPAGETASQASLPVPIHSPPATTPIPDPAPVYIHPPFTHLPDGEVLLEGMNYTVMRQHPTWLLDVKDYLTLDANPDGAVLNQYPRDLEPRLGGRKDRILRCTFCQNTYTGSNAKNLWTRHIREEHRVALSSA